MLAVGGTNVAKGSTVRAFVLDIAKTEGLIDLSLKPQFLSTAKDVGFNSSSSKKVRFSYATILVITVLVLMFNYLLKVNCEGRNKLSNVCAFFWLV